MTRHQVAGSFGPRPPGGPTTMPDWDPNLYDSQHAFVWKYGEDLLCLLDPRPGERVLDLGCGTGHLTAAIAARGAEAIGIDASPMMVEHARGSYPHIEFHVADARSFRVKARCDAVFSNAVLHWVREPGPVAACVRRALKPGGRFVAEFGGKGNIQALVDGLLGALADMGVDAGPDVVPWYYPTVGEYAALLERHGLEVRLATLFDRTTRLEGGEDGIRKWLDQFATPFYDVVDRKRRRELADRVARRSRAALYRDGAWHADYRRLRVVAVRPPLRGR